MRDSPRVLWLIGLSGAGKTTIASLVVERLRALGRPVAFLDGDLVREAFDHDLGYSLDDRRRNARRISGLSRMLVRQHLDVVCAVLSLFHETQEWNRKHIPGYFEVYLDVPMAELERRDSKGLYGRAARGEVTGVVGVDIPFTPPRNPDLVIANGFPLRSAAEIADDIVRALLDLPSGGPQ